MEESNFKQGTRTKRILDRLQAKTESATGIDAEIQRLSAFIEKETKRGEKEKLPEVTSVIWEGGYRRMVDFLCFSVLLLIIQDNDLTDSLNYIGMCICVWWSYYCSFFPFFFSFVFDRIGEQDLFLLLFFFAK